MDRYQINFIGQDYSPISDASQAAEILLKGKKIDFECIGVAKEKESDFKRDLLIQFLNENQKEVKTLIINKNDDETNSVKLYDPSFKEGYFGGVVGVLTGKLNHEEFVFDVKLQIQSRLDLELHYSQNEDKKEREIKSEKPYFLTTMLLGPNVKFNNYTVPSSEDELLDYLLLFWFRERLEEANLKGFYRTYQRFEKNDEHLKGSIDIARHIRLNAGLDNGKIAYSYRENTLNNPLNQLIIFSYEYLKKKYPDFVQDNFDSNSDLKAIMLQLKQKVDMEGVNLFSVVSKNLKPISHPYYTEYEELRLICLRILRNEGISLFDVDTDNEKTKGILFYLPDWWEKYLERKILENHMDVKTQEKVYIWGDKFKQETRPDFIFYKIENTKKGKEDKYYMILDAKFKPGWKNAIENNGSLSNILNDYDKAIRDAVDCNALATGVVFPMNVKRDVKEEEQLKLLESCEHQLSEANELYRFYTFPVCVPYSKEIIDTISYNYNYNEWKEKFDKNLQAVMTKMREIAEEEYDIYQEYIECIKDMIKRRK